MRRRLPLFGVLAADGISVAGNMLTLVAVPWLVLQTTGSAAQTGLAGFFAAIPVLISGPLGGVVVDRLGFRRASALADLASAAPIALIPLLHQLDVLELWHLLILVFLGGLLDIPGETARQALLPDVAEAAGMSLERATSARSGILQVARMFGAPVGAALIAVTDATAVLWIDAASFLVSALIVWVAVPAASSPPAETDDRSYVGELREGLAFVRKDRLILAIVLMIAFTNALDFGTFSVLLPVYADRVLDSAAGLGLLLAAITVGAVAGTFAYGAVGERLPRRPTFLAVFLVIGVPRYTALAAAPSLWVLLPVLFVVGVAAGAVNPILGVVSYERVPAELRGRVFGVTRAAAWAAMPLGTLLAGFLAQGLGLRPAFLIMGVLFLLASLAPAVGRVWRGMDAPRPVDVPA